MEAQRGSVKRTALVVAAAALLAAGILGLVTAQPVPPPPVGPAMPASGAQWTPAQLDQLTAPIALYPDPLLGSILAASTYPLEIVEAERWLEDPAHATLQGDALAAALEAQSWDASVKSLVPVPDVLRMMNSNLEWTEQLGDAFLAQQADVMQSVQRLRQRATAQGTLRSTPQQTVASEQNDITIEPTNPDVVYVPYYVPAVYGPWPWPDYPPYFFPLPPDVLVGGALIGFGLGIGIGIFEPFWGWYGCNWPGHGLWFYPPPRPGYPRPRPPHPRPGEGPQPQAWHHDAEHRRGVPYRDAATAARYLGAGAGAQRAFRGFPTQPAGRAPGAAPTPGARESMPTGAAPPAAAPRPSAPAAAPPVTRPSAPATPPPAPSAPVTRPSPETRAAPPAVRPAPPAFESFGRGPQVRSDAARGFSSRSASAPAPHGGGGHH
jgi:hypothetical protein